MGEKTVAQWVADQLAAWGVQSVYGLVGDAIIPLVDAVNQHPQLKYYSVKHEASAAFMASAEAKLTGRLGVCIATSGPGVANLINGLADAKNDQAPVLAITGQVEGFNIATDYKQYVNQSQLMAAVTEFSGLAVTPQSCNDNLVKAMRIALANGTVTQVSFTRDIWQQMTEEPIRAPEPYLKTRAQSAPEVITEAIRRLNTAQQPAIIVGRGIRGNAPQLFELAEKWGSGICYTMAAKGALPGTHPRVLGGLGEGGSGATMKMIAEAELIFIIGANWWPDQFIPRNKRIVQLDAIPVNIGARLPVEYGIVGDPAVILPLITEGISSGAKTNWSNRLKELRNAWLEQIYPEANAEDVPVHPARLMKSLERVIDPNAIVALDVGDHTIWFDR
ncbi:MAG TPA: thiamine pyrophosphate-binding protein, partial [Bacillota bacterium]|nr:thiamine pyrophosphate-binding protein [Bacillota bacterium]